MEDFREFYIISPNNSRYSPDSIIVDDATQVIIQKIEMILFTNKGDYMADIKLGCSLEFFLWQTKVSAQYITGLIDEQFRMYIPEIYTRNFSLEASIMEGELSDILLVDIKIDEYKIQALIK